MKRILSIFLISLVVLCSCAQVGLIKVDTTSTEFKWSPFPPDTIQSFDIIMGGAGAAFTSLKTEIRSYWALEEAAGDAVDSVGTADLPAYGTVTRSQTGILGDCFSFATDGYIGNIDDYYEFTGSFSISLWVKNTVPFAEYHGVIGNWWTGSQGYDLGIHENVAQFACRSPASIGEVTGTTAVNDNAWHHIVVSRNAIDDTVKIYIDGIYEDNAICTGVVFSVHSRLTIGSRYSGSGTFTGSFYTGLIDEPAIWNRELTQTEVDSLFAENQYPFLGEGSGGDSLELTTLGYDPRIDSVIVNWNYEGDGWPTDEEDGTIKFALPVADTNLYHDTIFPWPGLKDTTVRWTAWSGLDDVWTVVPNMDTVFIDSSDIFPPDQDVGIWDTIFYQDFEHHSAPVEYIYALESPDFNNHTWFETDHRWPAGWAANTNIEDSIVVDPITGSKVMKLGFDDAIIGGYDGQSSSRGGEGFVMPLGSEPKEAYLSYNMMLPEGWLPSGGGKFPGMSSSNYSSSDTLPRDGFKADLAWEWPPCPCPPGAYRSIVWYVSHYDMPGPYSELISWNDFQPVGEGLQYYPAPSNRFYLDVTDSVWVNITLRFVINTFTGTVPNHDGILEGFVNGYLISQVSDIMLINKFEDIGFGVGEMWFKHFFGGGGPPLRDEWAFFDDIYIFTYDVSVDVPRGQELSSPGRILNLPNWPKQIE